MRYLQINKQMCKEKNCKITPNFNILGQSRGLYCSNHKLDNMFNVRIKTCLFDGCKIHPVFNIAGNSKGLYCSKHKLDNMILYSIDELYSNG